MTINTATVTVTGESKASELCEAHGPAISAASDTAYGAAVSSLGLGHAVKAAAQIGKASASRDFRRGVAAFLRSR